MKQRYIELQEQHRSGSEAGKMQFSKWNQRVYNVAYFYAHGGLGYIRDYDVDHLDLAQLTRSWTPVPIRSFTQLSSYAHSLNWIVIRGKLWKET